MSSKEKESDSKNMIKNENVKASSSTLPADGWIQKESSSTLPADGWIQKESSSTLPDAGWIQKASRSHPDRTYYFNLETGQSVWSLQDIPPIHKTRPVTRSTSKEDLKNKNLNSGKVDKSTKTSKNENIKLKVKSPKTPKSSSLKTNNKKDNSRKSDKSLESYIADVKAIQSKDEKEKKNIGVKNQPKTRHPSPIKTNSRKSDLDKKSIKSPLKRKSREIKEKDSKSTTKRKDCKTKPCAIPKPIVQDLVSNIINSSNVLVKSKPNKSERFKIPKKTVHNDNVDTIAQPNTSASVPWENIKETTHNIRPSESTKVDNENVFLDDMEWEADSLSIGAEDSSIILPTDIEMFELDHDDNGFDHDGGGSHGDGQLQCIRVVDTNIYINDLNLVELIVVEKQILAVPWTVIQELDGLKTSNRGQVSSQARQASRWLSQQVKSKRPGIIFQKMSDVSTAAGAEESPDDKILLYCLYLKDLYGDCVSLVTDDTNLATKALIEEVEAFSSIALKEKLNSKPNIRKSNPESLHLLKDKKLPAISSTPNQT